MDQHAPTARPLVAAPTEAGGRWTQRRFFELLGALGALRVISVAGPSTFEAICRFGPFGLECGFMNAITPAYHWHLDLGRFRQLRSRDETHARSGRRVLFFELRERADADPFLRIYLYRDRGEEFGPERVQAFLDAHRDLARGFELAAADGSAS